MAELVTWSSCRAAARTLQVAITTFQGGALFSPFQWRRVLASNRSQVESFASECSAESVIGQLGSLHVLVVLPVGGGRIERLSFSRASEFVALLQGLFENFLLGGRESAVGRLLFKVGDGFLNLNNFTGGCLDFLVSFM